MVFSSIPHQHQHQHQHQQQQQDCEKKLDLNAPLMSVRRHGILHIDTATTTTSSSDDEQQQQQQFQQQWASPRSDFYTSSEAGGGADMRSPGAVPFMWERTPGRPKLEPGDEHRAVACSPSLPPGRMPSPSRCSDPRRGAPALGNGNVLVVQQKQATDGARKALLPFLLKESQHRKHKQSSLAQLFKRKAAVTPTSASASASASDEQKQFQQGARAAKGEGEEEEDEEDDEDGFSDAQQSENLTGMSLDPATTTHNNNNPAAERDFIMRRFLPAAKAMADESSASSSPFSSPILSSSALNQQQQQQQHHNQQKKNLPPSSPSSRQQVSASVERIQDCQYKFSSSRDGKRRTSNEDFAMKACGFFSFGLLRHLRPNYPSSRLRRASDRTNNRFASDDFQSSILINKVKDGLTIRDEAESSEGNQTEAEEDKQPPQQQQQLRHFGRTDYKQLKSPNRLLDSPSRETFYDCDTSFFNRSQLLFSPQKVKTPEPPSTYYRGSMSPSANNHLESKGFLGLPENYKPPEDPYRNAGYSPRNGYLSSKRSTSNSEIEIERNSSSPMAARNQSSLAKRVGKDLWLNTENSNLGPLNSESLSPGSRNGAPEESSELGWKMNNARKSNGSPAAATNGFGSYHGTSPRKQAELNGRGWPTLKTAILDNSNGAPALSPAAAAALPPTAAAPLLPPKSPTQSWLGKSLPFASTHETKAKWEAAVKSRQLRPGHLRYSEENALQPCEH